MQRQYFVPIYALLISTTRVLHVLGVLSFDAILPSDPFELLILQGCVNLLVLSDNPRLASHSHRSHCSSNHVAEVSSGLSSFSLLLESVFILLASLLFSPTPTTLPSKTTHIETTTLLYT